MNPHGPNTRQPRWLLPLYVLTIILAGGFGAALAFVT
jgi:hypothetical protein